MEIKGVIPNSPSNIKKSDVDSINEADFTALMTAVLYNIQLTYQDGASMEEIGAFETTKDIEECSQGYRIASVPQSIHNQSEVLPKSKPGQPEHEIIKLLKSFNDFNQDKMPSYQFDHEIAGLIEGYLSPEAVQDIQHNEYNLNNTYTNIDNINSPDNIETVVEKKTEGQEKSQVEIQQRPQAQPPIETVEIKAVREKPTADDLISKDIQVISPPTSMEQQIPPGKEVTVQVQEKVDTQLIKTRPNTEVSNIMELKPMKNQDKAVKDQDYDDGGQESTGGSFQFNTSTLNSQGLDPKEKLEVNTAVLSKEADMAQIVTERFKALRLPEITEIRVRLKPEDLGDIVIKVTLEKGQIKGSIFADKKEAYVILQNQLDIIKQELQNSNVNLNSLNVFINNDEGNNQNPSRHFNNQNKKPQQNFLEIIDEIIDNKEEGLSIIA